MSKKCSEITKLFERPRSHRSCLKYSFERKLEVGQTVIPPSFQDQNDFKSSQSFPHALFAA